MATSEDVIFCPPWYALAFLFGMGGVMLAFSVAVVGPIIPAPAWVRYLFIALASLALLCGVVLAFASVRICADRVASRHFRRWSVPWSQLEAWSQLGPQGSVFVRERGGAVRGFSSLCVYGKRNDELARLLEARLGPGLEGKDAVMPRWLRSVLGSMSGGRRQG